MCSSFKHKSAKCRRRKSSLKGGIPFKPVSHSAIHVHNSLSSALSSERLRALESPTRALHAETLCIQQQARFFSCQPFSAPIKRFTRLFFKEFDAKFDRNVVKRAYVIWKTQFFTFLYVILWVRNDQKKISLHFTIINWKIKNLPLKRQIYQKFWGELQTTDVHALNIKFSIWKIKLVAIFKFRGC
jgi:hypothetical protein